MATPVDAARMAREKIADGQASLACVVQTDGRDREVLVSYTQPMAARRVIQHYEAILEAISDEGDEKNEDGIST
jgi:thioredoxin-like negative regulator of GroEL